MSIDFVGSGKVPKKIESVFDSKHIDQVDIAVAYLSKSGYDNVEAGMRRFLAKGGRVNVIVGLSDKYFTESKALRALSKCQKKYGKRMRLKYQKPAQGEFHPKLMLARSRGKITGAVIGSSNLTGGGKGKNVEANVAVNLAELKNISEFHRDLDNFFRSIWETGMELKPAVIRSYGKEEKEENTAILRRKRRSRIGRTSLAYIYVDGKAKACDKLEVLCVQCKQRYIKIPINDFCCEDCGVNPSVEFPPPRRTETDRSGKTRKVQIKINDVQKSARKIALRCPECDEEVDFTDAFSTWIVCPKCIDILEEEGIAVCKPFSKWDSKAAKGLRFKLGSDRLIITNT